MPDALPNIDEIFLAALETQTPVERAQYLDQACGGNAEIRQRIDRLLAAHPKAMKFMESPAADVAATIDFPEITEGPGISIGPYKLLEEIGDGGMGVVFVAQQTDPVERRVALKIIKPGMDTRQVIARFEAERQALAMMDHPNIAKVLDAGTTGSGRPYFVMELVKGVAITQYCDEHHLTPRQRLELFIPVCQAVQHAHQKGVIHRDIKPSNVMVAEYDDQTVPKIIDFGLAKAIGHQLTQKTLYTEYGQIVGTIHYMSPEQAKFNQLDVDTRSDIYALGVLLYELLAGETPFDRKRLQSAAFDEILRIIREEEPPRPSVRLSGSHLLPSIAANRHTEPTRLSTLIRGEPDWIVMKAMAKDRLRRYETANALADDVQHYLRDEPVKACPPSTLYSLGKFGRKHRALLRTAVVVLVALFLGILGTTWQALLAIRTSEELNAALYIASMNAAQQAYDDNNFAVAQQYVERFEGSELCGLEWHVLKRNLQPVPPNRHINVSYQVYSVRFSANGRSIALGLANGKVAVWDESTGHFREYGNGGEIWRVTPVVSLDDHHVAYGSQSGVFEINLDTGEETCLRREPSGSWQLEYWQDGDILASGSKGRVTLWKRRTEQLIKVLDVPYSACALSFSPDGRFLAVGDARGNIFVWGMDRLDAPVSTFAAHGRRVNALSFSPCGEYLASGSDDDYLKLWKWQTWQEVLSKEYPDDVRAVRFAPDGHHLANGTRDGTVTLWRVTADQGRIALKVIAAPGGQSAAALGVDFSPDGRALVIGSSDTSAVLYDIGEFETKNTPSLESDDAQQEEFAAWQARFLPGSRRVAFSCDAKGDEGGHLVVWDIERNETTELARLPSRQNPASLAVSSRAGLMAVGIHGKGIQLWDVRQRCTKVNLLTNGSHCRPLAISADGTRLAAASPDGTVCVWDIPSADIAGPFDTGMSSLTALALSPDGRQVAVGCLEGEISLLDATSGNTIRGSSDFPGHTMAVLSLTFSPNGDLLASGGWEKSMFLWDLRDPHCGKVVFHSHLNTLALEFSRDGRTLFSGDSDMTVKVWDIRMKQLRFTFRGFKECVNCLDVSDNDRALVTGGRYGEVRLFRGAD